MDQPILFVGAAQLCCPVASLRQDRQQGKTVRGKLGWQALFGVRNEKKHENEWYSLIIQGCVLV